MRQTVADLDPDKEIIYTNTHSKNRVHTCLCRAAKEASEDKLIETTVDKSDLDPDREICYFCSHDHDNDPSYHVDVAAIASRQDVQTFDQLVHIVEKTQREEL